MTEMTYTPEMGQAKPEADIEARLGHYGNHYFLTSRVELKGRGINFLHTNTADNCVPGSHRIGQHEYRVTIAAYERLCKTHRVSYEMLLD